MSPSDLYGKTILISPLNWGMGHISRCIPLIKKLKDQNNCIIIACNKNQQVVFESYFNTGLVFIDHEGYPFYFKGRGNFISDTIFNFKELKKRYKSELLQVNKLLNKFEIDVVISDHRYGFRSNNCVSIFMTHQLRLPVPWYFKVAQLWHKTQVLKFDFQWIVDNEDSRLAGKLSNNSKFPNSKYIGYLSRFEDLFSIKNESNLGILLISGPPEYYPYLFDGFKNQLLSGEIDLIIGDEKAHDVYKSLNYRLKFHLSTDWKSTDEIICCAKKIFGYCGYSTLMDLNYLMCESQLIACPGQLEQLYLKKKS